MPTLIRRSLAALAVAMTVLPLSAWVAARAQQATAVRPPTFRSIRSGRPSPTTGVDCVLCRQAEKHRGGRRASTERLRNVRAAGGTWNADASSSLRRARGCRRPHSVPHLIPAVQTRPAPGGEILPTDLCDHGLHVMILLSDTGARESDKGAREAGWRRACRRPLF